MTSATPRDASHETSGRLRAVVGLVGSSRAEILHELEAAPDGLTTDALAERVGLHPNTVRDHLRQLVDAGLVTSEPERPGTTPGSERRGTRGRPRLVYRVVPLAPPDVDREGRGFEILAEALTEALAEEGHAPQAAAMEAGRAWGARYARQGGHVHSGDPAGAVTAMVDLLEEIGFAPRTRPTPSRAAPEVIELHHCPFARLARRRPGVVCSVHLGIVAGFLQASRSGVVPSSLEPFVGQSLCVLRVREPLALPRAGVSGDPA